MKCPYCGSLEDKVIDTRAIKEGEAIRRRRECLGCNARFTSYEHIEEIPLVAVKKDGRREPFDRNKIRMGLKKACEKRPISEETIEETVDKVETAIRNLPKKEIGTRAIGEEVMKALSKLDEVAYVRFASVYRQFKDISEFMEEVKSMLRNDARPADPPKGTGE